MAISKFSGDDFKFALETLRNFRIFSYCVIIYVLAKNVVFFLTNCRSFCGWGGEKQKNPYNTFPIDWKKLQLIIWAKLNLVFYRT